MYFGVVREIVNFGFFFRRTAVSRFVDSMVLVLELWLHRGRELSEKLSCLICGRDPSKSGLCEHERSVTNFKGIYVVRQDTSLKLQDDPLEVVAEDRVKE